MKDEGSGRPQIGDMLPSEAGILVRDALRAARHTLSVGRRRLEASPVPGGEIASEILSRVANRAEGSARRLIGAALHGDNRSAPARSLQALLHSGRSPAAGERTAVVRSAYRTLRDILDVMGAPKALVLESAIEAALASALLKGAAQPSRAEFPAHFAHQLMARRAVGHVAHQQASGQSDEISRQACFALGLAMTAELCDPVPEEETRALLAASCAMTLALRAEVAAAIQPEDIAALYRSYGPHV